MAKMIDQKPGYFGEAKVWESIEKYLSNDIIAYNGREINGREFDFCLFIENQGILIIEVKGWQSDKINVLGVDNIVIQGYEKPQRSPKKQARAYRFAFLNKIVEKYNTSPLIFDMVCYPFITKEEYKKKRLDIVSEEQFTIFKEDLEDQNLLINKIRSAYDFSAGIPHADLTYDLIFRLRQDWEPEITNFVKLTKLNSKPYSLLTCLPGSISENTVAQIVDEYFNGIKRFIFLSDSVSYQSLIEAFDSTFKSQNIEPAGNSLQVRYVDGLKSGNLHTRTFNLEIYLVPTLTEICVQDTTIEEGSCTAEDIALISRLSNLTSFNKEQFFVEHSSPENNTLVEAGAGTGKTYSMVSRVAFLCNKKINPILNIAEEVAMVTFTNDAAINMKDRLKQLFMNYFVLTSDLRYLKFIEDVDRAHISTIHSFALEIIRSSSLYTGLGTNLRISSNEYLRSQIYDIYLSSFIKKLENENQNFINEIPVPIYDLKKKILGIADHLLAKSIDLSSIKRSEMGIPTESTIPYLNDIIEEVVFPAENDYFRTIHLSNDMDLKECIILLVKILNEMDGKLKNLKLRYLFIDEFQDTDDAQIQVFQKLQTLINAKCRLFIVGDLKQSIYRFRGAKLSAFKQMKNSSVFDWSTHHLTINYRTDSRLLELYDDIFKEMGAQNYLPYSLEDQLTSFLTSEADSQNLFVSVPCHAKDENIFFDTFMDILRKQEAFISSLMQHKKLTKEERTIAVLVRSNWQVENLVKAAKLRGLKINTKSGGDLFQLISTQDFYKLVLALDNSSNPLHLINFIESNNTTLKLDYLKYSALSREDQLVDITRILDNFFSLRMGKTWQQIVNEAYTKPILYVLRNIYDSLEPWKQFSYKPNEQTYYMTNYDFLIERIIKYSRIESLTLNHIVQYLKNNILSGKHELSRSIDSDDEGIQLICTTIHKSKGLEYGTIVLPYTDTDISDIRSVKLDANYSESKLSYKVIFDNKVSEWNSNYNFTLETDDQIAEESRILYVALTRAIRNCVWIKNMDRNPAISWGSLLEE